MTNTFLSSFLFIFLLSLYQINQSLTRTLFSTQNDHQFVPDAEYFDHLYLQSEPTYDHVEDYDNYILPRLIWSKRDAATAYKVKKPILCFFNTVTCFG